MPHDQEQKTLSYAYVNRFTCLGAQCQDTCCQGWGMQVDTACQNHYKEKAPELLDAVVTEGDGLVMRRDEKTGYCVKFDNGLCGIHKNYGTDFLGDACHFFPRITRQFGDTVTVAATLSCPEIARLALENDGAFQRETITQQRFPYTLKDYSMDGLSSADALEVTDKFIEKIEDSAATVGQIMTHIVSVSKSLQNIAPVRWKEGAGFLLKTASARAPAPVYDPTAPYRLFHALAGLVSAAKQHRHPKLMRLLATMEEALEVSIDWESLNIASNNTSLSAYTSIVKRLNAPAKGYLDTVLRRWLKAQIAMASYPFAGFGQTLPDRATLLAIRFATVQLALLCHTTPQGDMPGPDIAIHVIQTLSRFLDHLANPAFSLLIYEESGWVQEANLAGLVTQMDNVMAIKILEKM